MAIGGNDNLVTVWDISTLDNPKLLFKMGHKAAVRALQYCPWSPALLATGGGAMDRRIRFWHTHSGTLLESIDVKEQVTSLNWSMHYGQIAATFGFGSGENMLFAAVYRFPKCNLIKQFPGHPDLRALSAVLSPNAGTIAVAANDETVKFYQLWQTAKVPKRHRIPILGSTLLELEEGKDALFEITMR
jgi:meiosis-specific APC/C activator protein AMA1